MEQIHPEGGALAYLIRFHGHQILAFEIVGLEPGVELIGAGASGKEISDYSGRLMRDLHYPALVLPTHWDKFLVPYGTSQLLPTPSHHSFAADSLYAVHGPRT